MTRSKLFFIHQNIKQKFDRLLGRIEIGLWDLRYNLKVKNTFRKNKINTMCIKVIDFILDKMMIK